MIYLDELFGLKNRLAVVTGGSSGIGAAMATALARAGARVVLVARDENNLAATAEEIITGGGEASWIPSDLSERINLTQAASTLSARFGEPDILVNCAGVNLRPPLGELTESDWDRTLALNLTAPFLLGQRLASEASGFVTGQTLYVDGGFSVT